MKAIERALHRIGVERQAYYSGTCVGNHVHKCLKVNSCTPVHLFVNLKLCIHANNIPILTASIVEAIQQIYPPAVDDADTIRAKFTTCFALFSKCHNLYNKAAKMEDEAITELGTLHCKVSGLLCLYMITFLFPYRDEHQSIPQIPQETIPIGNSSNENAHA